MIGGGYYTTGDLRTVNGTEYQKFIQGFVVLNNGGPQSGSAGCFQDAITHGLGHALGLGHTDSVGAMMQALPRSNCASGAASLGADDVTGITTIYQGIPSGPFPPGAPSALIASATLSTVNLSWTPSASGGPVSRHIVDAGTASGVYNLGSITINGSAPAAAFNGVPPGTYFVRVRAQNVAGTSAPSNEAQVNVGACSLPGPPGTLVASTNGTNVNLAWSAATSGVVQGYRLIVGSAPGLANLLVQDFPSSVTALGASGVAFGTYFARVAATNVCGVSPPSNEVTVVVQPCSGPPQAPTGLHFSRSGIVRGARLDRPGRRPATRQLYARGRVGAGRQRRAGRLDRQRHQHRRAWRRRGDTSSASSRRMPAGGACRRMRSTSLCRSVAVLAVASLLVLRTESRLGGSAPHPDLRRRRIDPTGACQPPAGRRSAAPAA